ncbi:uncharacterized protein N7525_000178 [Penicillium rubens]|uniref:uncharacterized protein n=1 Tax=Penicillium rubens TaxID=1108849 RepID=UPI002A59E760|nr:uncharacterized protein N7525_000178 [Penicillium rubens]KAJ5842437.1 hypothetical protein N7525_000178 [Penicillium rubens]KAJ5846990.1 hypothetical protein N7534_010659 [Penicillium rubens]
MACLFPSAPHQSLWKNGMFPEFAENVGWFGPCGPDVWCQRRRDLGVLFYVLPSHGSALMSVAVQV